MRSMLGMTLAAASLVGTTLIGLAPAAYADDAGSRTFWMAQPGPSAASTPSVGNNQSYTATYDYKASSQPTATSPATSGPGEDKDVYFYHSMGTMSHP